MVPSQSFEIQNDLFLISLLVCINESSESIREMFAGSNLHEDDIKPMLEPAPNYDARTRMFANGKIMIRFEIPIGMTSAKFHSIVAHELFHVTTMSLQWVGIHHSEETEECYAYTLGWLIKHFYENFKP